VSSITGTSDDITAEGGAIIDTGSSDVAESVAFHFNDTSWSQMTIPAGVTLGPLAAFSATDLWSVNNNGDAEQFNGSTWTTTKLPITTTLPDLSMISISGSSPSDIWAAGSASTSGVERRKTAPVLEHFKALALARAIGSSWDEAHALAGLGRCALAAGRRASKAVARRCYMQVLQSLLRLDVPIDKCPLDGHDEGEVTEPGSCRCVPVAVLVQELLDPGRPPADSQEDSSEP
jgi:hypothetical protein